MCRKKGKEANMVKKTKQNKKQINQNNEKSRTKIMEYSYRFLYRFLYRFQFIITVH